MKLHTDITRFSNTIGNVLTKNYSDIMALTDPAAIKNKVQTILAESSIDTPASKRLIFNLQKSKNYINSLTIVSNTVLAAQGNAVM